MRALATLTGNNGLLVSKSRTTICLHGPQEVCFYRSLTIREDYPRMVLLYRGMIRCQEWLCSVKAWDGYTTQGKVQPALIYLRIYDTDIPHIEKFGACF